MRLIIIFLLFCGCSQEVIREDIRVAWEIKYQNDVRERVMSHQHSRLTEDGCFKDRRKVVRCNVKSARRIPLHQVEKDGVMYELD